MTPIIFITAFASDEIDQRRPLRRRSGRLHVRTRPARGTPGQGLGVRQSVHPGRATRPPGSRSAGVGGSIPAARRRRADRDLPDRRGQPLHLHQSTVERDHRVSGRGGARSAWDTIIEAEQPAEPPAEIATSSVARAELSHRFVIRPPGLLADRARDLKVDPGQRGRHRRLGRDARRRDRRGGGRGGHVGRPGRGRPRRRGSSPISWPT